MARLVMDGKLWRNISERRIMRERANRNAQAFYLSAGYSDLNTEVEWERKKTIFQILLRI
jgi:hypothetical protein